MRGQPPDTTDDEILYGFSGTNENVDIDFVPKQCQLVPDVDQDVQVIKMIKVRSFEGKGKPSESTISRSGPSQDSVDLNSSGGKKATSQDAYHIAFGTKMAGTQPRKGSGKDGSSTSRQSKSSHGAVKGDGSGDGSISARVPNPPRHERPPRGEDKPGSGQGTRRERKNSDPGTNTEDPELTVDKGSLRTSHTWTDGADSKESIPYVKPHPPRQPSSEKRRRPRVKSAGKERTPHTRPKDGSSTSLNSISSSAQSSLNSSSQSCTGSGSHKTRHDSGNSANYEQPSIVANEDELERFMKEIHESALRENESDPSSHNTSEHNEDSISEVIQVLNQQNLDDIDTREYGESDGEEDTPKAKLGHRDKGRQQKIYTFSSKPTVIKTQISNRSTTEKSRQAGQRRTRTRRNLTDSREDYHRKEMFDQRSLGPAGDTIRSFLNSSDDDDSSEAVELSHKDTLSVTSRRGPQSRPSRTSKKTSPLKKLMSPPRIDTQVSQPPFIPEPAFAKSGLLQVGPAPTKSPHQSQTRMSVNRKSLREIPREELRKSGGQKPYNSTKYQMMDLSDSFEARMLESMRREQLEGGSSSDDDTSTRPNAQPNPTNPQYRELDSLSGSSDETEMSTLKNVPQPSAHNYQEEMKILSQDFLTQSNPRDWGNVFSPPIVVPGMQNGSSEALRAAQKFNVSPKNEAKVAHETTESDGDCELDLLYDPVLNCYYDPKSCKYYELV